MFKNMDFDYTL